MKNQKMNEHDTVVLTRSLSDHGLETGDVGSIVHVYDGRKGFEVEFVTGSGATLAVVTLGVYDIRPVATSEILHVRDVPT